MDKFEMMHNNDLEILKEIGITFTPSEVEKNPPILSQVTKEGMPLLDTDDFMSKRMENYETQPI